MELQALAIRDKKIYLQEMPALTRQPVELFMDMEGVPDRGRYYLIGLCGCQADTMEHYAFWADTDHEEGHMWQQRMENIRHYFEAPIYHYGAGTTCGRPRENGTIQMPRVCASVWSISIAASTGKSISVHSHGLKAIGHFLGARWSVPQAFNKVWCRHQWEHTQDETYRDSGDL